MERYEQRSNRNCWEGLCECSGANFPGKKGVALAKGLLLALVRDSNKIVVNLLEKDLDASDERR